MEGSALVLFSGGQDSTTVLAWALERFERVETIGFDYGQRHSVELACRTQAAIALRNLKTKYNERLGEDSLVNLSGLSKIWNSAMTRPIEIKKDVTGLPNTFVPGRNLLFLQVAASLAYRRNLHHLVGGMCEADSSGYPDCRHDVLAATMAAINAGMEASFELQVPLMNLTKEGAWKMAAELGGQPLVDLIVEESHTCYLGDRSQRHTWGYGCGKCPACVLRAAGYQQFSDNQ